MQLIDISSLIRANQSFDDIVKAGYIVQETRRTMDTVFFIDKTKIDGAELTNISKTLAARGVTPFVTEKPLYHYLDGIQNNYTGNIELISQDYLAISRAKEDTYIWDITSMKRYSTTEFSKELLDFPHSRLGFFSLLTQDSYHAIDTGIDFQPSSAISLVQTNASLKELIGKKNAPANLQNNIVRLANVAKSLVTVLKIVPEHVECENYFSSIALSKSEMRSLKGTNVDVADEERNFTLLNNPIKIATLIKKISESKEPKIYIELDENHIGIRVRENNYIAIGNDDISSEQIFNMLAPLLENDKLEKVALSAKKAHRVALSNSVSMVALRSDIELAEFTLNNLSSLKSLDDLMEHYFFEKPITFNGPNEIAHKLESIERLHSKLMPLLEQDGSLEHFSRVEMPMARALAKMEHNGVYVNSGKLYQLSQYIDELLKKEDNSIRQFSPYPVNISAPKEVAKLLFDTLGLPSKVRSTAEENLLKIERETGHPIIQHIIRARQLSKLNSTFAMKLPQKINPETNRIHGTYNQNKVKTGRLSCEDPNLQSIPSKTKLGRAIRKAFEAENGRRIVAADYSQVELKILAHLASDPQLIESFRTGKDIHQSTAALIFKKDYQSVTGEERKSAKAINFGLIYGMTKYGLANELGVTPQQAGNFIDAYFNALPATAKYIQGLKDFAQENGYVKSITGRKIHINNIDSNDYKKKESALRAASNAPMQGSSSDIIKLAMIKIDHEVRSRQLDAKINMQVHDEIVIDCAEEHTTEVAKIVKHCMENAVKLNVPLNVEVGVGENWQNAHPIEIQNAHEEPSP